MLRRDETLNVEGWIAGLACCSRAKPDRVNAELQTLPAAGGALKKSSGGPAGRRFPHLNFYRSWQRGQIAVV